MKEGTEADTAHNDTQQIGQLACTIHNCTVLTSGTVWQHSIAIINISNAIWKI